MLKVYRFLKFFLVFCAALIIIAVLFYESTKDNLINYNQIKPVTNWIEIYQGYKNFILYDPYYQNIELKVEKAHLEFEKVFDSALESISNLTADKNFYANIYIFMMSKKMKEMSGLTRQYFENIPSFKDLIIIDSSKKILYQLNSNTIIPEYHKTPEEIFAFSSNEMISLVKKYPNPLDLEIEIIAVLDSSVIIRKIKEIDFESFFILDGKIYKNADFNSDFISNMQKDLKSGGRFFEGQKIVGTFPMLIKDSYIGTLGIIYPNRGTASVLFIVFKIFICLLAAGVLFIIDRLIEKNLRLRKKKKNKKNPAEEALENDTPLEWLQNYVQKNEEKNEK